MALAVSIYPISPTDHVGSSRKPHQYMLATTFGRTCNWRGTNCKASAPPLPFTSMRTATSTYRDCARARPPPHQMLAEVHRVDTLVLSVAQFSTDAGYADEYRIYCPYRQCLDWNHRTPLCYQPRSLVAADRRGQVDLCEIQRGQPR